LTSDSLTHPSRLRRTPPRVPREGERWQLAQCGLFVIVCPQMGDNLLRGILGFWLCFLLFATAAYSHPGGLNGEGCHNNRKTGEYHCHRGGGAPQKLLSNKKQKKVLCEILPPCEGCGCKGGPGYRSHGSGKCVGYKQLNKECGNPPTSRCTFENAPNSGQNKTCVLGQ
jgi:hypothetical protein